MKTRRLNKLCPNKGPRTSSKARSKVRESLSAEAGPHLIEERAGNTNAREDASDENGTFDKHFLEVHARPFRLTTQR